MLPYAGLFSLCRRHNNTPAMQGREFNQWFSKDLIAKESFMKKVIICAEASALHLKKAIVDFLSGEGYDFTDATSRDDLSYIEAGSMKRSSRVPHP